MVLFFKTPSEHIIATEINHQPDELETQELCWLYGNATQLDAQSIDGYFVGPRREMITPWSTNAVEITQNMSLKGISRIEEYFPVSSADANHDPMLQRMYNGLDQEIFTVNIKPEPIKHVENLEEYNEQDQSGQKNNQSGKNAKDQDNEQKFAGNGENLGVFDENMSFESLIDSQNIDFMNKFA